jgi:hypothetical protein
MKRKLIRNYSLSLVALFIAVLILLIAAAMLAQTSAAGQPTGKANAVLAPARVVAPAQAERPLTPGTDGAGRLTVGRSQTKRNGARPMDGSPLFLPEINYDSGGVWAYGVAVGDLNGDGKPDLVVANLCDNDKDSACGHGMRPGIIAVMLGNGDGTFQPAVTYHSGGNQAVSVAVADLNLDGKLDVVVTNYATGNVGVLLGNGDGTLQPAVTYSTGTQTGWNIVIADLNGDGKPDLVVGGSQVAVLLGRGDGTFQPAVLYGSGGLFGVTVGVADMNLDGIPDIVAADDQSSVGVLLGNGDGTFQPGVTYGSGGNQSMSVAAADLNLDGKPDVVVTNYMSGNVGVLLGNGDGTLQPVVTYGSGGGQPIKLAVADLNGDGKADVAVTDIAWEVGVLLGNGDGTFQPALLYGSGFWPKRPGLAPSSVAIADVNGDGAPDLLVTYFEGGPHGNGLVGVLLNTSGPRNSTATELVPSANPVTPNQTVTYTATVASQSGGTVNGTVMFWDDSSMVVKATLAGNQAEYTTSYAVAGHHIIAAMYAGSEDSAGSISAGLTEHIEKPPFRTNTALGTSGSPSFMGQQVTFTATVTCGTYKIPDGELVTFYDGTTVIGTGTTAGGVATFTTSSLTAKGHPIKATYAGDTKFTESTGSVKQVVQKYSTTTALTSSLNPSQSGQVVTFTATVISAGPTPTDNVRFVDGTKSLGSRTLSGGIATLTTSKLAVGTHPITAEYLGDADNAKSTSPVLDQVVQ